MKRAIRLLLILFASPLSSSRAVAAPPVETWNLTTTDFRTTRVRLLAFDGASTGASTGATVAPISVDANADPSTISLDRFLSLSRVPAPKLQSARFVAVLSDGDRLAGEPMSTSGETLTWNGRSLGSTKISLRMLSTIVRAGSQIDSDDGASTAVRSEDVVFLGNGDAVRGIIADVSAQTVSIQPASGGDATTLPIDSVVAITFASTAPSASSTRATSNARSSPDGPAAVRGFRVSMSDSSVVTVASAELHERELRVLPREHSAASGESVPMRTVPLAQVVSIEQVNGPVVWLSSLVPTENVQTPYLEMSWPARMDASVSGGPIRIGSQAFARGIGAHAYSKLSFAIDPAIVAFRTRFAIDGSESEAPYADVTVRIKLDGKTAYEQPNVRAGSLSPVITLEMAGAKTITLEVDYGANGDVQDRFAWIEPALLTFKPVAEPLPFPNPAATRPTSRQ